MLTTDETEKAETQASEAVLTDVLSDEQLVDSFSQNEQTQKPLQYVTPRDVTAMQADYLAVFADKETDGKVLEDDFSRSGVTDWAQNAAVRNATASKSPDFEQLLSEGMQLEKFKGVYKVVKGKIPLKIEKIYIRTLKNFVRTMKKFKYLK